MKRKCMMLFLMGLLCLVGNIDLFSQHCIKMSYDKNGNRIIFKVEDCTKYVRGEADAVVEKEQCKNDNAEMIVYPNPTSGVFTIEMQNDKDALNEMSLYDYRGILVNSFSFIGNTKVDIRDKPAGAYLLRVVGDEYVRSVIVIKH